MMIRCSSISIGIISSISIGIGIISILPQSSSPLFGGGKGQCKVKRSFPINLSSSILFLFSSSRHLFPPRNMSSAAAAVSSPPVPKKVEHVLEKFGDVRVDHYYWLRDDSRSHPDILSHLQQENAYVDSVMSGSKHFEQQLFAEIRGRIKEDDISCPRRKGPYYYYTRTLEGKEYVQHCRRFIPDHHTPPSVHHFMPTGPNHPPEHVMLDENVNAQAHQFYSIGAFKVSPNHKLVAYAEDTKGDEIYSLYVIDTETKAPVGKPLQGVTSYLEWAGNDFLVYITMDEIHRADKVWLHKLGTDQSSDPCLYHEKDDKFSLDIRASESEQYLFIESESKLTRFILYIDVLTPDDGAKVLTPRVDGIGISVSHRGNHFFIRRRTNELFNSELLACPVDNISATTVLIPHRDSVKIWDAQVFADHLVVYERENGLPKITVYHLPAVDEPLVSLKGGQAVDFIDPVYTVDPEESEFSSSILRFSYSSLRTPDSVYEYDMNSGTSVLKKIDTVLGGFDSSNYVTERKWATALDGTQIPISIVYRKDLVKLDGSDLLMLYGYGSYEVSIDPAFKASRLSLLDRGFIFAIAHIRGGGEMGRQWYENGNFLKKKNTFTDFITCAEHLIEQKYCNKEKLCIEGRSAGGLLIGSVLNMRPDLFKAAIAGVPFVDVLTTMLDPSIPLTTEEWEFTLKRFKYGLICDTLEAPKTLLIYDTLEAPKEWGDPREEEFYFYMKSYSPVDNVKPQNYPHILITAGLHDPRVMYSEPAKFVAKLRDVKTDDNLLLFKCELGAGHFSKSGRFERLQEDAFKYTFLMKVLNMIPELGSDQKL